MQWNEDLFIAAIGAHVPDLVTARDAIADGRLPARAAERMGLASVAVAPPGHHSLDLAVLAARDVHADSAYNPNHLSSLYYAYAFHPEWEVHNGGSYVLSKLGLRHSPVPALPVSGGCNAGLQAVDAAASHLIAYPDAVFAEVAVADSAPPPVFDRFDKDLELSLGDAAVHVLVSRVPGPFRLLGYGVAAAHDMEGMHRGDDPPGPGHHNADHPIQLARRSHEWLRHQPRGGTGRRIEAMFHASIRLAARRAGVSLRDVDHLVLPFSGAEALTRKWHSWLAPEIDVDRTRIASAYALTVGHCGAVDPLLALWHLATADHLKVGEIVILTADGSGWMSTALVLEVVALPPRPTTA